MLIDSFVTKYRAWIVPTPILHNHIYLQYVHTQSVIHKKR